MRANEETAADCVKQSCMRRLLLRFFCSPRKEDLRPIIRSTTLSRGRRLGTLVSRPVYLSTGKPIQKTGVWTPEYCSEYPRSTQAAESPQDWRGSCSGNQGRTSCRTSGSALASTRWASSKRRTSLRPPDTCRRFGVPRRSGHVCMPCVRLCQPCAPAPVPPCPGLSKQRQYKNASP